MPSFDHVVQMHPDRLTTVIAIWLIVSFVTAITIIVPSVRLHDRSVFKRKCMLAGAINWGCLALLACWFLFAK